MHSLLTSMCITSHPQDFSGPALHVTYASTHTTLFFDPCIRHDDNDIALTSRIFQLYFPGLQYNLAIVPIRFTGVGGGGSYGPGTAGGIIHAVPVSRRRWYRFWFWSFISTRFCRLLGCRCSVSL